MSNLLETLNISKEQVEKVEVASIREGKELLDSGIYKGTIELFIFTTSGEVKMIKTKSTIITEENENVIESYTNIIKRDGKPNEFGLKDLKGYLFAVGLNIEDVETTLVEEKCYGSKKECNQVNIPENIPVSIFVRKVFEEGSDYPDYNEIEGIFDIDGKNANGEDQIETFMTKIEKMPVLKRKAKAKSNSKDSKDTAKEPSKKAKALL